MLAKLTALDEEGEGKALEVLTFNVKQIVKQNAYTDWEPDLPIRHAGQHSELCMKLIDYLEVSPAFRTSSVD